MKAYYNSCPHRTTIFENFTGKIKIFLAMLMLLSIVNVGKADICDSIPAPACNIIGPLKACLNDGLMTITTEIAFCSSNPQLTYSFPVNTTGATIVDTVFVSYNPIDSTYIQNIIIDPGATSGSINLQLNVTINYPNGCVKVCECSKSITIIDIGLTASFPPILCFGGTTTLTAVGTGANSYVYKLVPSGPSNTNGIFTGLPAGSYTVAVEGTRAGFTCNDTTKVVITQPAPLGNPTITETDNSGIAPNDGIICIGDCAGLNAGVYNGYSWSTGATTSAINVCPTTTTTYTVTVSNANGCTATSTSTIIVHIKPTPSIIETDNSGIAANDGIICRGDCAGLNAGSFSSYVWSTGATTSSINVCPTTTTTYTVTVVNANGCSASATSTVIVNPNPSVTTTPTNGTCIVVANICANPSGGSGGNYSYSWNTGATTVCINPAPAGTYSVTISDGNRCFASGSGTVLVNTTPPSLSCSNNGPLTCTTTSITLTANNCTGSGITYSWSGPGGFNSAQQCPTTSVAGTYTVTATSTVNGCTTTCTTVVGSNTTPPSLSCSNNGPLTCTTTSITLTANNCTGSGITYSWSGPGGFNSAQQCPSVSVAGTYTVTATSTVNGCTTTCKTVVGSNTTPPPCSIGNISPATLICNHGNYTIGTVLDPTLYNFSWSISANGGATGWVIQGSSTGQSIIFTSGNCGTPGFLVQVSLTVTDKVNGCQTTCTTTFAPGPPACNVSVRPPVTLTCLVPSQYLLASYNTDIINPTFLWTRNGVSIGPGINDNISLDSILVSSAGTYTFTLTDPANTANTCLGTEIVIEDKTPPTVDAGPDKILTCSVTSVTLTATASAGITLVWSPGGQTTASVSTNTSGTFTVTATNTVNGCTASDEVVVTQDITPPTVDAGPDKVLTCTVTSVTLTATASAGTTLVWSPGGQTTTSISTSTPGTFTVTATNPVNGCTATDVVVVTGDNTQPTVDAGPDKVLTCTVTSVTLTATASAGTTLVWSPGGQTTTSISTSTPGTFTVTVTNIVNGCTASDIVVVTQDKTPPTVDAGPDKVLTCSVTSVTLTATASVGTTLVWSPGGQTTTSISTTIPGTFTVTATNTVNGCTASDGVVVTQNIPPPTVNGGPDKVLTCTVTSVTLTATVSSCATIVWSPGGQTTTTITVTSAGTYIVTATNDVNGSTASDIVVVTSNQTPPSCSINITGCGSGNSLCSGQTAQLCASSGTGYKYLWNTGSTAQCITVGTAGTYSVTITNSAGCTSTCKEVIYVGQPPVCSIDITGCGADNTLCNGQTAQLCAASGNGYKYLWNTGSTAQCITVGTAGTYSVTITNSAGCTSTCKEVIYVGQPPVCSIDITGCGADNTLCNGQTAQLCAASGSGYKYLWSTGSTKQCITVGSAGTYSVTITNSAGCSSTCKQVIKSGQPPVCSIDITGCGADNTLCNGQSAQLCAASGNGYKYLWSTGSTKQCITVSSAGTYSVTITNSAGCSSTCKQVIKSGQPPVCSIDITGCGADNTLCNGQSAQLCAASGNGYKYLWSTGSTKQCITVSSAGTYSVTITNSAGCSSTCKQVIKSGQPPVCSINITGCGAGNSLCNGQTAQLCASSGNGYKYLWNTGSTKQCITVSTGGTYSVTVTNSAGCSSSCKEVIYAGQPPVCSINITGCGAGNSLCNGQTAQLCASSGNGYKYLWNTGSTKQCITVSIGGTYSVTVTNSAGCSSTCKEVIYAGQPPVCSINITGCGSNNSLCNGQTAQLCASSGNGYKYLWNTGSTKQCITVSTGGTYSVMVTNSAGCSSVCKEVIYSGQPPVCSINITGCGSNNSLCNGQTAQLCAASGNGYKYLWNTGSTKQCITVNKAATYSVMVTNSAGCSSICNAVIYAGQPPVCSINITGCGAGNSICNGQTAQLCASSGNGYKYLWSTGSTKQCITVNKAGTYSVTVTNSAGCSSTCKEVIYSGQPSCNITGDLRIRHGESTTLCGPSGYASYKWSTGSNSRCITVKCAGNYSLTVTNSSGCSSTCSVCVVEDCYRLEEKGPGESSSAIQVLAYPNPFGSSLSIEFQRLDQSAHTVVELYALDGKKVATLFDKEIEAGIVYKAEFKAASELADGLYIYRITSGGEVTNGVLVRNAAH